MNACRNQTKAVAQTCKGSIDTASILKHHSTHIQLTSDCASCSLFCLWRFSSEQTSHWSASFSVRPLPCRLPLASRVTVAIACVHPINTTMLAKLDANLNCRVMANCRLLYSYSICDNNICFPDAIAAVMACTTPAILEFDISLFPQFLVQ